MMEAKPLTKEALALTEKKMDMALDDIIKMSKNKPAKGKRARVPNKSQRAYNNAAQDKSMKLQRFMNSRSSLRQGVLAQKRSNFQGNQFPLAKEAARKAAVVPFRSRAPPRDRTVNSNRTRAGAPLAMNRSSKNTSGASKQHQGEGNGGSKQRPQTLDARFANLKEQREKVSVLPRPDNFTARRNGGGTRKQIPPWTRFPK
ncbi:uncharacterized protein LOC116202547 isoform X3 [Punica granatum]|uniref:Uncharacterized protein LOC116202547 isoform X3 n=1 Tax=Punica granatum TaxID=22663 RepID=A0A6P8CYW3_PUNGR|nr:uncharacterized protein LOC116202547 isoform X3 [Punica granatum]